ncbi:MAG: DNA methyltransferase [Bacteroidales bacterium]
MNTVYFIEEELTEVKEQLVLFYPNLKPNQDLKKDFFYNEYKKLDKQFNTRYDLTYQYLVNFSKTKNLPIHRWFYYQEGYSPLLIKKVLNDLNLNGSTHLFDPFAGSGTSLVAAKELGIQATGIEINPFSCHMALTKTQNYSDAEIKKASLFKVPKHKTIENLFQKYKLSIIGNLFELENLEKIELLKEKIETEKNQKVKNILFTALLCILQQVSYYKKAGNGLKKKRIYKSINAFDAFNIKLNEIISDIKSNNSPKEPVIINDNCLNINNYNINEIDISIFSPPYANCFDYYEVYKIELWLGEFVKSYDELRCLRKAALTSNLNADLKKRNKIVTSSKILIPILDYLSNIKLWDNKIPKMLNAYFSEMEQLLNELFIKTKKGGYCVIVVGNSSYGGLSIPTDIILSEIGKNIGFSVKEIIVARRNETSSQQYDKIGNLIEFVRESLIILKK